MTAPSRVGLTIAEADAIMATLEEWGELLDDRVPFGESHLSRCVEGAACDALVVWPVCFRPVILELVEAMAHATEVHERVRSLALKAVIGKVRAELDRHESEHGIACYYPR